MFERNLLLEKEPTKLILVLLLVGFPTSYSCRSHQLGQQAVGIYP